MRTPSPNEWEQLLGFAEYAQWEPRVDAGEIPPSKDIHPEARKRLNYVMTKGLIRDKQTELGKDFSRVKLIAFFHDELKLPKQMKLRKGKDGGRSKTAALDDAALRKLTMKFPAKIKDYGLKVIEHRGKMKEVEKLSEAWDSDGRVRGGIGMNTKAGRLKMFKNPMGKGYNLQNIKR